MLFFFFKKISVDTEDWNFQESNPCSTDSWVMFVVTLVTICYWIYWRTNSCCWMLVGQKDKLQFLFYCFSFLLPAERCIYSHCVVSLLQEYNLFWTSEHSGWTDPLCWNDLYGCLAFGKQSYILAVLHSWILWDCTYPVHFWLSKSQYTQRMFAFFELDHENIFLIVYRTLIKCKDIPNTWLIYRWWLLLLHP